MGKRIAAVFIIYHTGRRKRQSRVGSWTVLSIFGLSQWLSGKEATCNAGNAGDAGLTPGLGRSPGEGNGIIRTAWNDSNHSQAGWGEQWGRELGTHRKRLSWIRM